MFKYGKEQEIQKLHQELDKYKSIPDEPSTVEDIVNNAHVSKREIVKNLETALDELYEDKKVRQKAYNQMLNDTKTKEAQKKYKSLVEEYHACIERAVEIGSNNIIESDFNLNSYTEFSSIRGDLRKHLHMASVGVERINRQTAKEV